MSPRAAAIDVGSHSVKLTVAERDGRNWRTRCERVEITGLGRGEPRRDGLDPAARQRTLAVLSDFADILRREEVGAVVAVATAVLRHAPDAGSFVAAVRERTGIAIEVLSGDEEARLTYLGAVSTLPAPAGGGIQLVFDIGGASTELAWGSGRRPEGRLSLDLGTIALARRHGLETAVPPETVAEARAEVDGLLAGLPAVPVPVRLVGIGATPTTMLALERGRAIADGDEAHGQPLTREAIARQIERLRRLAAPARRELPGLHPDRAEVVLAGALITAAVAARWSPTPILLSACGLRAGLLRDRFDAR
jgi:exopolyphosphatase/guanosine-5'-triphosphate,3'-diphosphate pyrophosphatase